MRWIPLLLAPCAAQPLAAQTLLASGCAALDAVGGEQHFVLADAVPAGSWIVLSVATDSTFVELAPDAVSDSAGNAYSAYDSTWTYGYTGALVTFAGRAVAALGPGDEIDLTFQSSGSAGTQSCVAVSAFANVPVVVEPGDAYGESTDEGTSAAVATAITTPHAYDLVYSAFAATGSPGATMVGEPSRFAGGACSTDQTLCVATGWSLGGSAGLVESAIAASENATPWGALIVAFRSEERIFAGGFE